MHRQLQAVLGLALLALLPGLPASETNFWPFFVRQENSAVGRPDHTGSLGPLFSVTVKGGARILSIRPLVTSFTDLESGDERVYFLYPVAAWKHFGELEAGNVFAFTQYWKNHDTGATFYQNFPIVFKYQAPDPAQSYFAIWPLGGELKNRFWRDRITFALWPLYVRTIRGDETRHHTPYPFVQRLSGPHSRGFGLWPLYGHFEREGDYTRTWALWPLYYNYHDKLDEETPYARFGVLPLYHSETAAGLRSETFLWPFFGYTRETAPRPVYSENRYFWPLLVQGRGEERHVNRWMPIYTRESRPGYAKRWFLWPVLKLEDLSQPGLARERTSLFYFVYRDERQRFGDARARLTTVWPLFGYWNDGRGQRQLQLLDPFTAFFPSNEKIKENWAPLFALYRRDERAGNRRHSLLWDLLVWERDAEGLNALYLGPLFEWVRDDHWDVLQGLAGGAGDPATDSRGTRFFWKRR